MRVLALISVLFIVVCETELPAQQTRTAPFALAALRRDGLALLFASFDGRRWEMPWPTGGITEIPISIANVPKGWWGLDEPPTRLTRWVDGVRSGQVSLTGLRMSSFMCSLRLALRTDYKPSTPPPPPIERPYPKDGLLVAGDVDVGRITPVENGSPEWTRVQQLIVDDFNRRESEAADAFTSWRHPIKSDDRKRVPITMEALYRAPMDTPDWTAYFVEAVRQFPAGRQDKDGCGLATFASGWVALGPQKTKMWLGASITYCDRKDVRYMLPFGLITANAKNYWVFQYAGFEGEGYEVVRPTSSRLESQVVYSVGSCPG